ADPVIAKQRRSRQARAALFAIDAALDTLRGADLVPGEWDGEGGGRDCAASVGGRTALSAASELRRITRADILIEAMRGADVLGGSDLAPATGMAQPAEVEALLAQLAQELTPEQAAAFQAGAEAIVREGAAGSGQGGGLRAERVPRVAAPRPPRSVSPLLPPSRLGEGGGAEEEEGEDTPPSPPSDPEAVAALAAALARRHERFDAVAAGVAPPPTVGGAGQEGHEEGGARPRDAVDELRAALAALKHRRLALRDMAAASDALSREVATALAVEALGQRRGFEGGLGEEEGVPGAAAGAGAGGEAPEGQRKALTGQEMPTSRAKAFLARALEGSAGAARKYMLDFAYSTVDRAFFQRREFDEWATTVACVPEGQKLKRSEWRALRRTARRQRRFSHAFVSQERQRLAKFRNTVSAVHNHAVPEDDAEGFPYAVPAPLEPGVPVAVYARVGKSLRPTWHTGTVTLHDTSAQRVTVELTPSGHATPHAPATGLPSARPAEKIAGQRGRRAPRSRKRSTRVTVPEAHVVSLAAPEYWYPALRPVLASDSACLAPREGTYSPTDSEAGSGPPLLQRRRRCDGGAEAEGGAL
ncbi:ALY3, partial [Symbiodinium sp. KB8]